MASRRAFSWQETPGWHKFIGRRDDAVLVAPVEDQFATDAIRRCAGGGFDPPDM